MLAIYLYMRPYFIEQQGRYNHLPTVIYMYFFEPLLYLAISTAILCGCSLVWDIRIRHQSIRLPVLIVVLTYILFHYIAGWLAMRGGEAPSIVYYYLFFFVENRAIFLLPGVGLFLGLNGRRTGPELECRR
jgi:hypothetical protein